MQLAAIRPERKFLVPFRTHRSESVATVEHIHLPNPQKTTKKERLSRSFNALHDVVFEYVEYFVYIVFCVDV